MRKYLISIVLSFFAFSALATPADSPLTLDFKEVPVRDILQILANMHHTNLVISGNVNGNITLHLEKISWQHALEVILNIEGLGIQQTHQVLLVAPLSDIAAHQEMQQKLQTLTPLSTIVIPLHYAKAETVAALLKNQNKSLLSPRGTLAADTRTNKLWIEDTSSQLDAVQQWIHHIDIPIKQVLIEARIVTLDKKYEQELGIRLGLTRPGNNLSGSLEGANKLAGNNMTDFMQNPLSRLNVDLPVQNPNTASIGLALSSLGKGNLLDLELSALETEGAGQVVSSPRLMTADQQPATILSGQEIPYQQSANYGATTIAFQKAVLNLTVTPQITPEQKLLLTLQVNQDRPGTTLIQGVPEIDTREIKTQVLVNNGQTVVLGGIYEQNQQHQTVRVPFLGSLPIIGALFRHSLSQNSRQELLIFITPTVINP